MDNLQPIKINDALRKKIFQLSKDFFAENPTVSITVFNTEVLIKNNIDYKEYVTSGKSRLKRFMLSFPDIFDVEETIINGGIQYLCSLQNPAHKRVVGILTDMIVSNGGKYLLAKAAKELDNEYGIDYNELSGGKKFRAWLQSEFSDEFETDDNNLWLAKDLALISPDTQGEVSQMDSLVLTSWWINNLKSLQKHTEQLKTSEEWRLAVARGFSCALLGIAPIFCYTTDDGAKIVFDTGIDNANGNSLYCVLKQNPNGTHPFAVDAFCCVAEEDSELSNEIKQNAPNILQSDNVLDKKYEELRTDLELLIQHKNRIGSALPELNQKIDGGSAISQEVFTSIKGYYDRWNHAKDIIKYLGWSCNNEEISIDYLVDRLEYTNRKTDIFKKATDMFITLAEKLSAYCKDNLLEDMSGIVEKDIQTATSLTVEQTSEFENLLSYYSKLMEITEYTNLTNELALSIAYLNEHFEMLTLPIYKLAFHKKTASDFKIENKDEVDEIISLIQSIESISAPKESDAENNPDDIDGNELLEKVIAIKDNSQLLELFLLAEKICTTRLEKAIVSGDYSKCKTLINNGEVSEFEKGSAELLGSIATLESNDTSFTYYDCAKRLSDVLGSCHSAEKYYIIGLLTNSERCSQALMDIYVAENEPEKFYAVWDRYANGLTLSAEKTKYLLYALCSKGEAVIEEYLAKNISLLYVPEFSKVLISALKDFGLFELLNKCEKIADYIASAPEPNDFEKQIINTPSNAEFNKVADFIDSNGPLMESLGYTQEETQNILHMVPSIAANEEVASPVTVLFSLQGNKNRTVEKYLWTSLQNKYKEKNCLILLNILFDENRFEELCALYECYEDALKKSQQAREFYLGGLLSTNSSKLFSYLCSNIQDCLNMIATNKISVEQIKVSSSAEDERVSLLREKIAEISSHLNNDIIKSIIVVCDDLREIATNTEKLVDFGLDANQIENFASVYKTDAFPRGRNILNIAERIYSFINNANNAAKDFADLATECGFNAKQLLWKIYANDNNTDAQLQLLTDYPDIRSGKEAEYLNLLIQKKEYEKFLSESEKNNIVSPEVALQTIIAKAKLGQDVHEDLANVSDDVFTLSAQNITETAEALADANLYDDLGFFVINNFEKILSAYAPTDVESIITANGKLSAENIKALQKSATAVDCKKLTMYLYENFGVGRYKSASKEFLTQMLSNDTANDRKDLLQHLRTIYAKNAEFTLKIALNEITYILSTDISQDEKCKRIEKAIDETDLSSDGIVALIDLINTHNLPVTQKTCEKIVVMCDNAGLQSKCIDFINSIPSFFKNQTNVSLLNLLCGMYDDMLNKKVFKPEWIENAIEVCEKLVDTEYFYRALYCAYSIQTYLGNKSFAMFNLFNLLERKQNVPQDYAEKIEAAAKENLINENTNLFDLFVQMATVSSLNEIEEYCTYCGKFIVNKDSFKWLIADKTEEAYSLESSIDLLKALYCNPKSSEYWSSCVNMPLENSPVVYAKLLYKSSLINNKETLWKRCIDACEIISQEDLLMDVLIDCAKKMPAPYGLQNLRALLAEKTNTNPLYFSQANKEKLATFISVMCKRMEANPETYGNHNAIRDLSTIAIATDSKEAYSIMMDFVEEYIYGEDSNLGFAIVCRLILNKRFEDARPILARLATIPSAKYQKLIAKLAAKNEQELSAWSADNINKQLLRMILPNGNLPDIHRINDFALSYISQDKAELGASLICELLANHPDDYGCYMALFVLCKQMPNRLDMLHRALCGLTRNKPMGNSKSFYHRTRRDYAVLLANINAVIMSQQINEEVSAYDGYDFKVSAREFYQKYDEFFDTNTLMLIDEAYENIQNALMNQSPESTEIIYKLVFGYVTGDWSDFFTTCWKTGANPSSYLNYYSEINTGIARSILKVAYSLDAEHRHKFIEWIGKTNKTACDKQIKTAVYLFRQDYYNQIPVDVFEENILNMPFEEKSVREKIFANTVVQAINKAPASVFPVSVLVGCLSCADGEMDAMSDFWQKAMQSFELSNDNIASKLFHAMFEISRKLDVYHGKVNNPYKPGEMYESMTRISGAFAGDEEIIKKIKKATFNPWSCLNMVLALMYTKRANEVIRLRQYFADENRQIVDVALIVVDSKISDNDKFHAINSMSNEVAKGLLFYIIKYWDNVKKGPAFLNLSTTVEFATESFENIAKRYPKFFGDAPKYQPRHFIWIESSTRIHESVNNQLESTVEFANYEVVDVSPSEVNTQVKELSIVTDLEPIENTDKSIEQLWTEHEETYSFDLEGYKYKLDVSKQIYQIALGNKADKPLLDDYALRYGIDYYYNCMGNKEYREANNIIIEMVNMYEPSNTSEGANTLKNVICSTALHELLYHGYSSIRPMVEDYLKNKQAFIKMRNMLPANSMSIELNDVNCIYTALETIGKCLSEATATHTSALRSALITAISQLGNSDATGWSNVRQSVAQLMRDEIIKIDKKPIIDVKIISKTATHTFGYIFGQIKNIGNDVAENVVIQLEYSNKATSNPYMLTKLGKGETAAFEIQYSVETGTESLDYNIALSYDNNGEKYSQTISDSLTITESFEPFPTGLYLTDRPIVNFELAEDGTIFSKDFFGRDEEKRRINEVFVGNDFANYKNVIIKGIRRAGKTSVLNYLLNYANKKCPNTIAVYLDCGGDKGGNCPIQYTLIDSVIRECRMSNIGGIPTEKWDEFAQKWALDKEMPYRNSNDLQYFYRELKEMNGGYGLMLVLDEFDVLIEELENIQGVDSTLLPSLRSILNSPYCQDAIHLVICGSTKLTRYMDGGTFNQLFQQFGDNIIEIGRLLEKDMEKMLTVPYGEYPSVTITDEAIDWIWKYTSGLVWYSKLVANCALNRALLQERSVIYPSDVVDAVVTVTSNDDYFKSLVTSCRPNELKVIDAIQCSTSMATEYVTIRNLLELLSDEFPQKELESIINSLERLQVIQRNPFDRYSFRFAVELYWHYFRVSPSNHIRCAETPVIFKEGKTNQNNPFDKDYFDI